MKKFGAILACIAFTITGSGQSATPAYPSLLWEITGNGLTQPSYLFGTMHVSNKMVFHLSDSFYNAIASCSTVSLELDPRQWQSEMFRLQQSQLAMGLYTRSASDFLRERSFRLNSNYENNIKRALSEEPYVINGLLYRTMEGQSNFQENTYLDLYVYQTARRLGKKATGVENYMESERIQLEAQEDMLKDRNRNRINFNNENPFDLQRKIQDAYRKGDLSLLDSLSQASGGSEAFNEKFLYGRNEIQANSIDSIIHKESLFVAVGAAHLPGKRGVIELLRKKGYTLRPVSMTDHDAEQRDRIDRIKVPVEMQEISSGDGFIHLKVPGKLFRRAEISFNESWQYADMENGAYYTLSRIKLHPGQAGETVSLVTRKTDSLLYEYVPGKILQKKNITVSGYRGLDITNKTRRGDIQRYQILYTPAEVLVFKMSGNEDYVSGKEAEEFFSSIRLKEAAPAQWVNYTPPTGGFSVSLPQVPDLMMGRGDDLLDNKQYEAIDAATGDAYMIWQKPVHNYNFLEEDTLDISLIEESVKGSDNIDKELSRRYSKLDGYNSLDMVFSMKDGDILKARAFIRGAQYYLLTARGKDNKNNFNRFFNSFRTERFRYGTAMAYTDPVLGFSVRTPVQPAIDTDLRDFLNRQQYSALTLLTAERYQSRPLSRNAYFKSDSTGEAVQVTAVSFPKYYAQKDSSRFWENELDWRRLKEDVIIDRKAPKVLADSSVVYEYTLSDTNTNRKVRCMAVLTDRTLYRVSALEDGLGAESSFIREFFSSFRPEKQASEMNVFTGKADRFARDLESSDSSVQKIARSAILLVNWEGTDLPVLKRAFYSISPGSRDYLSTKTRLIQAVGFIRDTAMSAERLNWLKYLYENYADTSMYQNAAVLAMAAIKNPAAYTALKEILVQNPPIFDNSFEYQSLFRNLGDSLQLAAGLYPDILQLTVFDDYKQPVIGLLTKLVDSSHISPDAYSSHFNKLFFDAQVQTKKLQLSSERELVRSQADQERVDIFNNAGTNTPVTNLLGGYISLLAPYYDKNPQVAKFFTRLLQSSDVQARMLTALALARINKPVPDSIWNLVAANDQYRLPLYERLEKMKKLQFFPTAYRNQEAMSRSVMVNSRAFFRAAEIQSMGKRYVETKKGNGYVYLFKYRLQKQGDWLIGLAGIQPSDTAQVNTDRSMVNMNNRKLLTNGTEQEQYDKLVRQLVLGRRKSAAVFYTQQNMFDDLGL
ncbi:MAG: TraB/GumN family protein [Chitinophagaceae bacterium]|nr:TraB/GumN family protein [Chitinophagaceae bacterium]